MTKKNCKLIDFAPFQKKKIYNEFQTILFKEFNMTVDDINYVYDYERNHLFEVLEESFDDGGPNKMRLEIDYTIESFKLDFSKNKNNSIN